MAERVAKHMGQPFDIVEPQFFEEGVSKQHKSHGTIPPEAVPLLNELYEPYNQQLIKLLLSNNFPLQPHMILSEFKPYQLPPGSAPEKTAKEIEAAAAARRAQGAAIEKSIVRRSSLDGQEEPPPKKKVQVKQERADRRQAQRQVEAAQASDKKAKRDGAQADSKRAPPPKPASESGPRFQRAMSPGGGKIPR